MLSVNYAFAQEEIVADLSGDVEVSEVQTTIQQDDTLTADEDNVVASSDKEVLGVETTPATIKMGKVTKRYNGAIQYQATFYDASGNPLKNQKVIFEVDNSNDYESTTDANGVALLTVLIKNGNHKISTLNTETLDIASDNIKVFNVITGNKNLNVYYDSENTYKVRIFDDNGKPVKAGQKVTFYIGDKYKYTKSTDKNGYAKLKINVKPGYYEIGVKYKDYVVVNRLFVKDVVKSLTSFSGKTLSSKFKYKVKYLGKNKKNKKITVKFNKKTYKAKTNKKGIATFMLKTPKKSGSYKVVTSYKKSKITSVFYRYST